MQASARIQAEVDLRKIPLPDSRWLSSNWAIIFALWSLWLSITYFGLGPLSFVFLHDTGDSALPYRIALSSAVINRIWGYWDFQKVVGIDSLSMQVWPFQPDVMVFALLPGWLAYGLIKFVQRFMAGYFTFRLLTGPAGLPPAPSLYAGLVYGAYVQAGMNVNISGFSLDNGFLTEAGLPFVLWALSRLDAYAFRSYIYAALVGLFFACTAWFPNAVYLLPMVFFWFIVVPPKEGRRFMLIPLSFTLAWSIASLPLAKALIENVPLSHRADWPGPMGPSWDNHVLHEYMLRKVAFSWQIILDNAWALGLAVVGLFVSRRRDRRLLALVLAAMLCLVFQPIYGPVHEFFHQHLVFLKAVNFNRVYLLVPFLLSLAAAFGASHIPFKVSIPRALSGTRCRELSIRSLLIGLAVIWVLGQSCVIQVRNMYHATLGANFKEFYLHPAVEQLSLHTKHLPPFRVATVAEALRPPACLWTLGFETPDGYVNVYSKRYQEFWEKVISPLILSNQDIFRFFHNWGSKVYLFSPSYFNPFPRFDRAQFAPLRLRDHYNLSLLSLANVQFLVSPVRLADENLSELPRVETGNLIAFQQQGVLSRLIDYVAGKKPFAPLYIYENRLFMPRFLPMTKVELFDQSSDLLDALGKAEYEQLRTTAFLKKSDVGTLPLDQLSSGNAEVKLLDYSADRIVLGADAASDFILVISHNYSPYWKASIDGRPATVFPADHTFQGLYVTKGRHEITLRYQPPYAPFSHDR
ncbi:MAG: YfhO family protein [Desulfomonile tiedjei]|nr:YfhO family protein [Desulfomonile tiedjei]